MSENKIKRVAVVHDWLVTHARAEKVLEQILGMYARVVFSLVGILGENERQYLGSKAGETSIISKISQKTFEYQCTIITCYICDNF